MSIQTVTQRRTGPFLWRIIAADTVALAVYSLVTGIVCIVFELLILGFTTEQWLGVRLIFNGIRYPGASLLGAMTDRLRIRLGGNHHNFWRRSLAATTALSAYHMPIYTISAVLMGVTTQQILIALPLYFAEGLLLGWSYGLILDKVRTWFRSQPVSTSRL